MDVTYYQEQVYQAPPCWSLVADVYSRELGLGVDEYKTISTSVRQLSSALRLQAIASAFRLELHKGEHGFEQVEEPADFAVVLMGRTPKLGVHHCGIYYAGKVLHAMPDSTLYQDLESLRDEYRVIEFWSRQL
jgi:hypothetical protein